MRERVVLVPGAVGLAGAELLPLATRLHRRGYDATIFWHWTGSCSLVESAARLRALASSLSGDSLHFVGHSIGGLVILRMLADEPWERPGLVLTMGTPHDGLAAARLADSLPGVRRLLGHGVRAAANGSPIAIPPGRAVATVAGDRDIFSGAFLAPGQPSDGLIGVWETKHPGSVGHRIVYETHAGLLYSKEVASLIEHFLRHGALPAVSRRPTAAFEPPAASEPSA